jgi:thiamine kinase-like enzyme
LADNCRAFFKGTSQDTNEFAKNALRQEERVYQELAPQLVGYMPHFYASLRYEDWHCLLLEDVGPRSVPPWTPHNTRQISHALAAFHQSTRGIPENLPAWLERPADWVGQESWLTTAQHTDDFRKIAVLVSDSVAEAAALHWFQDISSRIEQLMNHTALKEEPFSLLHGDLRSDNLRFNKQQQRLYLFDWPALVIGRPEWDIVAFAQSVTVEGGPLPEQVLSWYREKAALDRAVVDCALAWCLTFFAERAWQPEIPGLPRLRRFQKQQLGTLILWIARQWSLPTPHWANELLR